jgi:hypothetical protein
MVDVLLLTPHVASGQLVFFFLSKETRKGAQFTTKEEDKEAELVAAR